jgi:hypothetical protein
MDYEAPQIISFKTWVPPTIFFSKGRQPLNVLTSLNVSHLRLFFADFPSVFRAKLTPRTLAQLLKNSPTLHET